MGKLEAVNTKFTRIKNARRRIMGREDKWSVENENYHILSPSLPPNIVLIIFEYSPFLHNTYNCSFWTFDSSLSSKKLSNIHLSHFKHCFLKKSPHWNSQKCFWKNCSTRKKEEKIHKSLKISFNLVVKKNWSSLEKIYVTTSLPQNWNHDFSAVILRS